MFFHGTNFKKLVATVGADRLRPRYGGTMPCNSVDGAKLVEMFQETNEEFKCEFFLFLSLLMWIILIRVICKTVANAFGLVENKNVGMPSIVPVAPGKVGPKYKLGPVLNWDLNSDQQ